MSFASAIYTGWVRHRRFSPRRHAFTYDLAMMYLDLSEIEDVMALSPFFRVERTAPATFRRSDYLGDRSRPLDACVRDVVETALGRRPSGAIRLLTHLRYFGYCFNPVSFYYCFSDDDTRVEAIIAEITNTPWRERHAYVVDGATLDNGHAEATFQKAFHVSPFMPMDMTYRWRLGTPGKALTIHMENARDGATAFDATMTLRRRPLSGRTLGSMLVRYPLMTLRVVTAIHFEALRLKLKGVPFHSHPAKDRDGGKRRTGEAVRP